MFFVGVANDSDFISFLTHLSLIFLPSVSFLPFKHPSVISSPHALALNIPLHPSHHLLPSPRSGKPSSSSYSMPATLSAMHTSLTHGLPSSPPRRSLLPQSVFPSAALPRPFRTLNKQGFPIYTEYSNYVFQFSLYSRFLVGYNGGKTAPSLFTLRHSLLILSSPVTYPM